MEQDTLPVVLTADSDNWSDEEWSVQWQELLASWIPSHTQLVQLDDIGIAFFSSASNIPLNVSDDVHIAWMRRTTLAGHELGVRNGWWEEWNDRGPVAPPIRIQLADWIGKSMAELVTELKWFPSVSQARKNGWNRPVEAGRFKMGKNRALLIV